MVKAMQCNCVILIELYSGTEEDVAALAADVEAS